MIAGIFCAVRPARAAPEENLVLDGMEYAMTVAPGDPARELRAVLPDFHERLTTAERELFEAHDLPRPPGGRVRFARDARDFAARTGRAASVAALYVSAEDRYYFQNPLALSRRGFLERVIRHEVCHRVFFMARGAAPDGVAAWLEEGYCETLARGSVSNGAERSCSGLSRGPVRRAARWAEYARGQAAELEAATGADRARALCRAAEFVAFLQTRVGRAAAFRAARDPGAAADELAGQYARFRARFE